jgi:TolB-like protein/Tfp pilus assembly protein PilF
MSLFEELKRRNVIRVAVLYLVSSWVLLQLTDVLSSLLDVPESVGSIVILLLIVGFVPVVLFAWVYEMTPEGVKRQKDIDLDQSITAHTGKRINSLIIVLLLVAIAVVVLDRLLPETAPVAIPVATEVSNASDSITVPAKSIAVLPFADLSPGGDQEYFSDGIAEEILNVLVRIEGLKVASRTTAWGFKGQEALGVTNMAAKMNVRHVLEGSVRKSGDTVRITAQLIDAATDQHLWSETYDRTLTAESLFQIQDDIAKAIVAQLGIIMETDIVKNIHAADTSNIDAYELYLEASQLFAERRSLLRGIDLFEQAVAADPGFARAWAGLAANYQVAPGWGYLNRDYITLAREAAETAIELNPELSLPYAVLGMNLSAHFPIDYERVLALFDEALARNPKNTTAYLWRTIPYLDLGYFDRAEQEARQCLDIDPAYEICRSFLAVAVLFSGDTERALEIHETALRHGFAGNADPFMHLYVATGQERTALIAVAANNAASGINNATQYEYRALTDPAFDYKAEKTRIDQAYIPAGETEPVLSLEHPDFLFRMRQYDQLQGSELPYWWFPYPLEFRNSPHRKRLMNLTGMPVYWRKHGFPPQCRPVGDDDFECD